MCVHNSERSQGPRDPVPSQGEGFQARTSAGASENDVAGRVCPPQDLLGADTVDYLIMNELIMHNIS